MNRLIHSNGKLFAVSVSKLDPKESQRKWDYRITVSRLAPTYDQRQNFISGGLALAQSVADSLLDDLAK